MFLEAGMSWPDVATLALALGFIGFMAWLILK